MTKTLKTTTDPMDPRTMAGVTIVAQQALADGFSRYEFRTANGTRSYGLYRHDCLQIADRSSAALDAAYALMLGGATANEAAMRLVGTR